MKKQILSVVALTTLMGVASDTPILDSLMGSHAKVAEAAAGPMTGLQITNGTFSYVDMVPTTSRGKDGTFTFDVAIPDSAKATDTYLFEITRKYTQLADPTKIDNIPVFNSNITGKTDVKLKDSDIVIGQMDGKTLILNDNAEKYQNKTVSIQLSASVTSLAYLDSTETGDLVNAHYDVRANGRYFDLGDFDTFRYKLNFAKQAGPYLGVSQTKDGAYHLAENTFLSDYASKKGDVLEYRLELPEGLAANYDGMPVVTVDGDIISELTQVHPTEYVRYGSRELDTTRQYIDTETNEIVFQYVMNEDLPPDSSAWLHNFTIDVTNPAVAFLGGDVSKGELAKGITETTIVNGKTVRTRTLTKFVGGSSVGSSVGDENTPPALTSKDLTIKAGADFDAIRDLNPVATDKEDGAAIQNNIKVLSSNVDVNTPGVYDVKFEVKDKYGLKATSVSKVTVVSNDKPVITANDVTIKKGEAFAPMVNPKPSASDTEDKDITKNIKVTANNVDNMKVGVYNVTYEVTDSDNNTVTKTVKVTVIDDAKPVIDASDVSLKVGGKFDPMIDPKVSAQDAEDGPLTSSVKITSNNVDVTKPGVYNVSYEVKDKSGNIATKTIKVTVTTDTKPVISATPVVMNIGDKFDPMVNPAPKAADAEDGDITKNIKVVENTVDPAKEGTYKVTYEVADSDKNVVRTTVSVIVKDGNLPPVVTSENLMINVGDAFDPIKSINPEASDDQDGDLTGKIVVKSGSVDTSKPGVYKIVYEVTDSKGKTGTSTSLVIVNAVPKDGKDGVDGKDGAPGTPGKDGEKGDKGDKGDTGAPGKDGVDGKDGAPGTPGKDGEKGDKGDKGDTGAPGKDGVDGKDGAPGTPGKDGEKGDKGDKGDTGAPGKDGVDGKSITVVSNEKDADGNTIVTLSDGTVLTIPKGDAGDKGDKGEDGKSITVEKTEVDADGNTIVTLSDGSVITLPKGADGLPGKDGVDGKSITIVSNEKDADGNTVITFSDGTSVTVINGKDGKDGVDGKDGKSITIISQEKDADGNIVVVFSDGTTLTIPKGDKGEDGKSITVEKTEVDADGNTIVTLSDGSVITLPKGADGLPGKDGADGKSITIVSNEKDADGNTVIEFSDGTKVTVVNGKDGEKGDKGDTGAPGKDGVDGKDGKSITIISNEKDADGNTVITFSDGSTITVQKGKDADPVAVLDVKPTVDGDTVITLSDGSTITIPKGKDGKDGKDGLDGIPGVNGKDGESIAIVSSEIDADGNTVVIFSDGTKITILKGSKGDKGEPGEKGETGAPGKDGVDGKDGAPGEKGDKGEPGIPGKDGEKGETGAPGKDGADGKDGAPGEKGDKGEPGTPGKDGEKGDKGEKGDTATHVIIDTSNKTDDAADDVKKPEVSDDTSKDDAASAQDDVKKPAQSDVQKPGGGILPNTGVGLAGPLAGLGTIVTGAFMALRRKKD